MAALPFAAYYPTATVPGLDLTLTGTPGVELTPGYPNLIFAQDFHTEIKEPAVFGEVSYQPIEPLKLTAGLRWYQVKNSSQGYEAGLATGGGPAINSPYATTTESGVNPKFEADYHLTPDDMVYANVAKGYRPGGLVPIVPAGQAGTATDCVAALKTVDPNITLAQTRSYQSDSLWNYELGAKTAWFDHRLTVDAAGFYIKWKDIQQEILLSCGFQYTANAGAAESKGGELEIRARPIDPLEISLGAGYQNATITEQGAGSPQTVGSPIYQVPNWTGNGAISYTTQLTERLEADRRDRLFLYRPKLQRQQQSGRTAIAALLPPHQCALRAVTRQIRGRAGRQEPGQRSRESGRQPLDRGRGAGTAAAVRESAAHHRRRFHAEILEGRGSR